MKGQLAGDAASMHGRWRCEARSSAPHHTARDGCRVQRPLSLKTIQAQFGEIVGIHDPYIISEKADVSGQRGRRIQQAMLEVHQRTSAVAHVVRQRRGRAATLEAPTIDSKILKNGTCCI